MNPDEFLAYALSEKLLFSPGTDWSYNNTAYRIAATLVEKVAGVSFTSFMKEHVFLPAGMMHTYIATDLQLFSNLPDSYTR